MLLPMLALLACTPTPKAPPPVEYTVVKGDTLSKIAREYGVTVEALRATNGISGDLIDIGQVLLIPGEGTAVTAGDGGGKTAQRRRQGSGGSSGSAPTAASPAPAGALSMPAEQACLDGPSLDDLDGDEPAMAASVGLSHAQASAAMRAFVGQTSRCISGDWPVGVISLDITVACTGRVQSITVADRGGLPAALTDCVVETLRHAPFPAHDMPDGFTFGYPLRFSAP